MSKKLKENIQQWLPLVERAWRIFKGSRHSSYARFLAILGAGLLSPSLVEIALKLLEIIEPSPCLEEKINIGAIGGIICLSGSIISFIWGEIIAVRAINSAEASEGKIVLGFDDGWDFISAANRIAQAYRKPIHINGFTTTECQAPMKPGEYEFGSALEALAALRVITKGVDINPYSVDERNGVFILTIGGT